MSNLRKKYYLVLTKRQERLAILGGVLLLAPILGLTGLWINNALTLTRLGQAMEARVDAWKEDAAAIDRQVTPASLKDPIKRNAYRLVNGHGELLPERRVIVTVEVPIGLKKNGADRPGDLSKLADDAAARTQEMAERECALLVGPLAAECMPVAATGRRIGANAFEYQLQLAFREAQPFGKRDRDGRYDFTLTRSTPGSEYMRKRFYFAEADRQRQKIYAAAADACKIIRKRQGNCSITALSVASKLDPGTPMARLAASAAYASLVPTMKLADNGAP
jgi:hypothetical protein